MNVKALMSQGKGWDNLQVWDTSKDMVSGKLEQE